MGDEYVKSVFLDLSNELDYELDNRGLTKKQKKTLIKMLVAYLVLIIGE